LIGLLTVDSSNSQTKNNVLRLFKIFFGKLPRNVVLYFSETIEKSGVRTIT
jgi:hypothetical protein